MKLLPSCLMLLVLGADGHAAERTAAEIEAEIARLKKENAAIDAQVERDQDAIRKLEEEDKRLAAEQARLEAERKALEGRSGGAPAGAKPNAGSAAPRPVRKALSSSEITSACYTSYREAAAAGNHLDSFDSDGMRTWCGCLTSKLSNVLTPDEIATYLKNPVQFVRRETEDPAPGQQRNWRLFTPITSCWQ